jgi:hypothetical protein
MVPVKINENNIFAILTKGNWILLALLAISGLAFGSTGFALGILVGGLIAIVNSYWLYSILQRAMQLPVKKAVRFTRMRYFLRMGLIAVVVSGLIVYCNINIIGLLLGLSVFVINIIALTIYMSTHKGG